MFTAFEFMLPPFVASLLLLLITVYFGIHVIKREIIFIDIALAQIAALGSAVTLVINNLGSGPSSHAHEHDSRTLMAYAFCLLAAGVFTILKNKRIKIPMEAIIGIAYAVATTTAVIILDKGAGSDVHIHDMLAGTILWVTWQRVLRLSIVVLLIGGFHFFLREKFKKVTLGYEDKNIEVAGSGLWDFLFYFTFGIMIVEAVSIGGILTVFAFLIIPASVSALFAERWTTRILIGLVAGFIATLGGLWLSWTRDLPSSPAIVMFLGICLLLAIIFKGLKRQKTRPEDLTI